MESINNLLEELDSLKLDPAEYVIVGSGPLAIRGIRSPKDLDILVSDDLWRRLKKQYGILEKSGGVRVVKISESIEALGSQTFPTEPAGSPSVNEQIAEAEIIADHPFQSVSHWLFFKKMGTREKDVEDVKLMSDFFAKNS